MKFSFKVKAVSIVGDFDAVSAEYARILYYETFSIPKDHNYEVRGVVNISVGKRFYNSLMVIPEIFIPFIRLCS